MTSFGYTAQVIQLHEPYHVGQMTIIAELMGRDAEYISP